ncbi:helix-turn-helix domain-containing protein [Niallia circulans]|uniref:helix-turn-helix domain-containing protein n=1 Tax=Niallia circulans TaxID=1397 RepID=UPI00114034B6|nr:helix-turn-helix transcriptional regulator [Niallia circulans]
MKVKVVFKLKDLLHEKKMTQKELSERTKIREATISDIVRGSRTVLNYEHLEKISNALGLTDIRDIIDLEQTKE